MIVLDSSALLALLQDEPGAATVEAALPGAVMSPANLAEVLAKGADRGLDVTEQLQLLTSLGIGIEPVTVEDARLSAEVRRADSPDAPVLSLGDRLCLALALRLDAPVLTADQAWTEIDHGARVRLVR